MAADGVVDMAKGSDGIVPDRGDVADSLLRERFGMGLGETPGDHEWQGIVDKVAYGQLARRQDIDPGWAETLVVVALTADQATRWIGAHVGAALSAGSSPERIREAIIQCTPYLGLTRVETALSCMHEAFDAQGVELPLEDEATVDEDDRLERGMEVQTSIFGDGITRMRADAEGTDTQALQDLLSAYCFGDFYTRKVLSVSERELVTFCALAALGCAPSQMGSHAKANVAVGNGREVLIAALMQLVPYLGFPRTLNALGAIDGATTA